MTAYAPPRHPGTTTVDRRAQPAARAGGRPGDTVASSAGGRRAGPEGWTA
jgi:hypothetical protein